MVSIAFASCRALNSPNIPNYKYRNKKEKPTTLSFIMMRSDI